MAKKTTSKVKTVRKWALCAENGKIVNGSLGRTKAAVVEHAWRGDTPVRVTLTYSIPAMAAKPKGRAGK